MRTESRTIVGRKIRLAEAGPFIALSSELVAICHRANTKQRDDYKRAYSGVPLRWFTGFRSFVPKAAERAGRVKGIDVPTLVFWGELDVLVGASNTGHLDAVLPQCKLHILSEAGHRAWTDQPELVVDMIVDWLDTAHQ